MRRLLYLPAIAIAAWSIGVTAWSLVDVTASETIRWSRTLEGVREVAIDHDEGTIEVVVDPDAAAGTVRVEVAMRQGLQDASATATVDERGRLVLHTRCPNLNTLCKVDATVHVPRATPVSGGGSGRIRVTGVGGPVDLDLGDGSASVSGARGRVAIHTRSGRIEVYDSDTDLDLSTGNGSITVDGVAAASVSARTNNGSVRLSFSTPPTSVDARTGTGHLDVLLPADAPAYALTTDNAIGSVDAAIRTDPVSEHRMSLATTVGRISVGYR